MKKHKTLFTVGLALVVVAVAFALGLWLEQRFGGEANHAAQQTARVAHLRTIG